MNSAIFASDSIVAEQASDLLRTGAVEAVVGAALLAAAREPSVFFGPLQILVGGLGTGLFAIDGRVRQPGLGVVRPRGFRAEDEIPAAAYVGVPAFAGAVFAALALTGNDVTQTVFGPAISVAKTLSKPRAELLNRVARKGAGALADGDVSGELVAVAGRIAGGLLTQEDLTSARPEVGRSLVVENGDRRIAIAPWTATESPSSGAKIDIILAVDARGQVAAACYETSLDAIPLGAFDLSAPRSASPVLRGQTRTRPGEPIPTCAPLAITHGQSLWESVLGVAQAIDGHVLAGQLGDLDTDVESTLRSIGYEATAIVRAETRVRILRGG